MLWILKRLRKLIAVLRGGATPVEVGMAATLGVLLGFVPLASALTIVLGVVILVLNLPLSLVLFTFALGKLAAVALRPVTYGWGRVMLEVGPVRSAVAGLANAPFTAWMDLDRYCTLGGIPVGLLLGLLGAVLLAVLVRGFRGRMAKLEAGSERFQRLVNSRWFKVAGFILFGRRKAGKGKTYADILAKKTRYVRKGGVIVAVVFVVLVLLVERAFAPPAGRWAMERGMTRANGATVDIGDLDVSILGGRLALTGLQVCDPDDLGRNWLAIDELACDFDVGAALARRLVIQELSIGGVHTNTRREVPGEALPKPETRPLEEPRNVVFKYLKDPEFWRKLLDKYREFRARRREQEEQRREELDYGTLRATDLVLDRPALHVRLARATGVKVSVEGVEDVYAVELRDVSTNARLAGKNPTLRIGNESGTVDLAIGFNLIDDRKPHVIGLETKPIPVDRVQRMLSDRNKVRLQGGQMRLSIKDGRFSSHMLDIPIQVELLNLQAGVGEGGLFNVDSERGKRAIEKSLAAGGNLNTTLTLRGRPYLPTVAFDGSGFLRGLAGIAENLPDVADDVLREEARAYEQEMIEKLNKKYGDKVPKDVLDAFGIGTGEGSPGQGLLRGILGRDEKKKEKEDEEGEKKGGARGLIEGIFGR